MTESTPEYERVSLVHSEEITEKLARAVLGASKVITNDHEHFKKTEVLSDDPHRLRKITESLFASADTLIYLAESIQASQKQREKIVGARAISEVMLRSTDVASNRLTFHEQAIIDIMNREQQSLKLSDFIGLGFGLDVSDNIDVRKSLFKKTIQSLSRKQSSTISPIIATGNTRARTYGIHYVIQNSDEEIIEEVKEAANVVIPHNLAKPVAPTKQLETPALDVFAEVRDAPIMHVEKNNQIEALINETLTRFIENAFQSTFKTKEILQACFNVNERTSDLYGRVARYLKKDARCKFIGQSTYVIIGFDNSKERADVTVPLISDKDRVRMVLDLDPQSVNRKVSSDTRSSLDEKLKLAGISSTALSPFRRRK
jgi:hypothetical protein